MVGGKPAPQQEQQVGGGGLERGDGVAGTENPGCPGVGGGEADRVRRSAGAAEPDLARCHGVDDFGDPVAGQHWVEAAVSPRDGRGAVRGIDAGSLCSAASGR